MDLLPKSSTHRRSKQPSTKSSESSENDKLARFSSADEDAPLMPRAAVPSPLLAATMRLEIESVHEFVAGTILYSHRIPVLVQSGIVKNGQKSRCVQSEPPPIQRAHSILQALYRDFLRHLALHCKTCFSVRCRACLHVLLVSLILLFFQRPPLSSHVECSDATRERMREAVLRVRARKCADAIVAALPSCT